MTAGRIRKLEDDVVQRIAAGEVIQRPSNAIKELLENSLDAGATAITITVVDGGYKSFTIQDNGHGILREDLALLCERYATSKLQSIEDLRQLHTFGFRGEALASISHIARIAVTTRTDATAVGYKASYIDGKLVGEPAPLAANIGTTIVVQDLFYNNPVRSAATGKGEEHLRILDMAQRYALERAGRCSFTVRKGATVDLMTRTEQSAIDVVRLVYGDKVAASMMEFEIPDLAKGLVSNAYYQQKSFTFVLFINGRLVESPRLKRAIASVYAEVLLKQTHPFAYLSLNVPPDRLDVNVHPTKREVIFLDEDRIANSIVTVLREKLAEGGVVKTFIPTLRQPECLPDAAVRAIHHQVTRSTDAESRGRDDNAAWRPKPTPPKVGGTTLYPFQQIHTDHKTRTLDFFVHKKARLTEENSQHARAVENDISDAPSSALAPRMMAERGGLPDLSNSARTIPDDPSFSAKTIPDGPSSAKTIPDTLSTELVEGLNPFTTSHPKTITLPSDAGLLTSIKELRGEAESSADALVTELLRKHTFVGQLDHRRSLIQFETSLIMVDVPRLTVEWIYLELLLGYGHLARTAITADAPSIRDCVREHLLTSAPCLPEHVEVGTLEDEVVGFISDHTGVFEDFLGIQIGDDGRIQTMPSLLHSAPTVDRVRFGEFLLRAVIDCNWDDERSCVGLLFQLYAEYLLSTSSFSMDKAHLEHVLLPALRRPAGPGYPTVLSQNGAIMRLATTHELYKIFERC